MNADGSGQVNLTKTSAYDYSPEWSPDGSKIVFESLRDGNPEIYVMNADGDNVTRLTHDLGIDYGPKWSPDGKYVFFISNRTGDNELYRLNVNNNNLRRLTQNNASDYEFDLSPDGSKIVFAQSYYDKSNADDILLDSEIMVVNSEATGLTNQTNTPSEKERDPFWIQNGKIIFIKEISGKLHIVSGDIGVR